MSHTFLEKVILGLELLAKACNCSTQEAKEGGLRIQDLPWILISWRCKIIQLLHITLKGSLSVNTILGFLGLFVGHVWSILMINNLLSGKQDWMVRKGKIPVRRDQDERRDLCLKLGQVTMISLKVEI